MLTITGGFWCWEKLGYFGLNSDVGKLKSLGYSDLARLKMQPTEDPMQILKPDCLVSFVF